VIYRYIIHSLKKKTIDGVEDTIFNIVWEKVGFDENGNKGSYKTAIDLDVSGVGGKFINYEDLTKKDIVGWIKNLTDKEKIDEFIERSLTKSITKETVVNRGHFPWDKK
jgi:hypothetical protein